MNLDGGKEMEGKVLSSSPQEVEVPSLESRRTQIDQLNDLKDAKFLTCNEKNYPGHPGCALKPPRSHSVMLHVGYKTLVGYVLLYYL